MRSKVRLQAFASAAHGRRLAYFIEDSIVYIAFTRHSIQGQDTRNALALVERVR